MTKRPRRKQQQKTKCKLNNLAKSVNQDKAAKSYGTEQQPSHDGKQTKKIMWLLKTVWKFTIWPWQFAILPVIQYMTEHHGFMTFLATATIAWLTWTYVDYSGRQWQTMQQQLELSQRPWISPTHALTTPLVIDNTGGVSLTLRELLENTGESVALDVSSWADMFHFTWATGWTQAQRRQKQWCDANRHPNPKSSLGDVIFPKKNVLRNVSFGLTPKQVLEIKPAKSDTLIIVGCIYYRSSFKPRASPTHQTRFAYFIALAQREEVILHMPTNIPTAVSLVPFGDGWSAD